MPELTPLLDFIATILPSDFEPLFMRRALLGLLLLAPLAAAFGVRVVNFRMAFFSDAISHSVFAGVALALIFAVPPHWAMPLFGILVGVGIIALKRHSRLSADTAIGVLFASVTAFGLAIMSREPSLARDTQRFLYGDILTISDAELWRLAALLAIGFAFEYASHNRLMSIGIHPVWAKAHGVRSGPYEYTFAALLATLVVFSVWAVGVLLVTALLVVPAAAARQVARSAGGMFWGAIVVAVVSAVLGLWLSAQEWLATASGATVILCSFAIFLLSALFARFVRRVV